MKRPYFNKHLGHCCLCGKKVLSHHSSYCPSCSKFGLRLDNQRLPVKTAQSIRKYVRKNGFKCYYFKMPLEMKDFTSAWYYNFNHWAPRDPRKIVLTTALTGFMKGDKTQKELWYYILQLDDHRRKHTKFRKKKIIHWKRIEPPGVKVCPVCGKAVLSKHHRYCSMCSKIANRMSLNRYPPQAMQGVWDYIRKYGYTCYYTRMELDLDDAKGPWYLVFDHWIPRDPRKIVLTSRMVNEMKQDMTEKEFWYIIDQFANFIRKGTPVRKIKLKYWSRPYIAK